MARPRQFNDEVLRDSAREIFWSNGFDSTSVSDISAATKIGNGSIYAAYGSKFDLFFTVLESYCASRIEIVQTAMDSGATAAESVQNFFGTIVEDCVLQPARRGCLMLNSVAEFGGRDERVVELCRNTTEAMEERVAARLELAVNDGSMQAVDVTVLAAQIVLVSQGLIQMSRLHTPEEKLTAIADAYGAALPWS